MENENVCYKKKRKMLISQGEHPGSGVVGCPGELSDEGTWIHFIYNEITWSFSHGS